MTRPRLGTRAGIADVVAFLVSPAGHWVDGQVVGCQGPAGQIFDPPGRRSS